VSPERENLNPPLPQYDAPFHGNQYLPEDEGKEWPEVFPLSVHPGWPRKRERPCGTLDDEFMYQVEVNRFKMGLRPTMPPLPGTKMEDPVNRPHSNTGYITRSCCIAHGYFEREEKWALKRTLRETRDDLKHVTTVNQDLQKQVVHQRAAIEELERRLLEKDGIIRKMWMEGHGEETFAGLTAREVPPPPRNKDKKAAWAQKHVQKKK
jgi:hypothetical protein